MSTSSNESQLSFEREKNSRISTYQSNKEWRSLSDKWLIHAFSMKYMYNFSVMGRPVIQIPTDLIALQEIIWSVKPDLIIETGIAHGGSLIFSASMLSLLDYCEAVVNNKMLDPKTCNRRVLGIDIDIRPHNRAEIDAHPMSHRIDMIQGSSIDPEILSQVREIASNYKKVMVLLDSNHTHDHVIAELEAYSPLVSAGSYCVVFDTIVEDLPDSMFPDRPWSKGNNPKTAVWEYLQRLKEEGRLASDGKPLNFQIDTTIVNKLLITAAPDGYLKRT